MRTRILTTLPFAFMTLLLSISGITSFSGCTTTTPETPDAGPPDPISDAGELDADTSDAGDFDAAMDAGPPPGSEAFLASEILGRPTANSITLNVVPAEPLEAYVEWGPTSGAYDRQTMTSSLVAQEPFVVDLIPEQRRARVRRGLRVPN